MSQLTENIKNLRLLHGYTQRQIAKLIDRSPSTISNWEKGVISPDADSIDKLCQLFKCNPSQLFGYEKNTELEQYLTNREDAIKELEEMQKQRSELDIKIRAYQRLVSKK